MVLAQSTSVPQFAERPGVIRVKGYKQRLAIESDGKTGSKGKARAHVGTLTKATHVKAMLIVRHVNAWCLLPEIREWVGVQNNLGMDAWGEAQFIPETWLE